MQQFMYDYGIHISCGLFLIMVIAFIGWIMTVREKKDVLFANDQLWKENAGLAGDVAKGQAVLQTARIQKANQDRALFDLQDELHKARLQNDEDGIKANGQIRILANDLQEADGKISRLTALLEEADNSHNSMIKNMVSLRKQAREAQAKERQLKSFILRDRPNLARYIKDPAWVENQLKKKKSDMPAKLDEGQRNKKNPDRMRGNVTKGALERITQEAEDVVKTMQAKARGRGLEAVLPGADSVNGKNK